MGDALLTPGIVYRLGRTRAWHAAKVRIEAETTGWLSCDECEAAP